MNIRDGGRELYSCVIKRQEVLELCFISESLKKKMPKVLSECIIPELDDHAIANQEGDVR